MRKKLIMALILSIMIPKSVYAAEPVISIPAGATVVEDMIWPSGQQIEEAEQYLSENRIEVPTQIKLLCKKYGKKNNICPELLEAMIFKESCFIPEVVGSGNCVGLMQVKPNFHRNRMQRLGVSDMYDAEENIAVGSDYLAELYAETGDIKVALMLYNGDSNARMPGYESGYVKKILKISEALEQINCK